MTYPRLHMFWASGSCAKEVEGAMWLDITFDVDIDMMHRRRYWNRTCNV